MHRGFNLELTDLEKEYDYYKENESKLNAKEQENYAHFKKYIQCAKDNYIEKKQICLKPLKKILIGERDVIDGSALKNKCFPVNLSYDIFLSHSHRNSELALYVAGILKKCLKLDVFIDWALWEYCDELLKEIDKKYCYNEDKETFSYISRNHSTSHVHLMLNTALMEMMDYCECLFFLNTPDSINLKMGIENRTLSPWIFSEISMSRLIKEKDPIRTANESALFEAYSVTASTKPSLEISYATDISHLFQMNEEVFYQWITNCNDIGYKSKSALDYLYANC